jgi:hypothetical protein
MHAHPFRPSASHNRSPLELVHTDLHGPLPVTTHSGYKYWITFIDDTTRFRAVYLLKAKSEAFEAFKVYKSWAENQLGVKMRALQDDKGGEYMSKAFLSFTEAAGIFFFFFFFFQWQHIFAGPLHGYVVHRNI